MNLTERITAGAAVTALGFTLIGAVWYIGSSIATRTYVTDVAVAPLATKEDLALAVAPLATRDDLTREIDRAVAPLVTRQDLARLVACFIDLQRQSAESDLPEVCEQLRNLVARQEIPAPR